MPNQLWRRALETVREKFAEFAHHNPACRLGIFIGEGGRVDPAEAHGVSIRGGRKGAPLHYWTFFHCGGRKIEFNVLWQPAPMMPNDASFHDLFREAGRICQTLPESLSRFHVADIPDDDRWLVLVFRLSWEEFAGSPHRAHSEMMEPDRMRGASAKDARDLSVGLRSQLQLDPFRASIATIDILLAQDELGSGATAGSGGTVTETEGRLIDAECAQVDTRTQFRTYAARLRALNKSPAEVVLTEVANASRVLLMALEAGVIPGFAAFTADWRNALASVHSNFRGAEADLAGKLASVDIRFMDRFASEVLIAQRAALPPGWFADPPIDGAAGPSGPADLASRYSAVCDALALASRIERRKSRAELATEIVATLREMNKRLTEEERARHGPIAVRDAFERLYSRVTWGQSLDVWLGAGRDRLGRDQREVPTYQTQETEFFAALLAMRDFAESLPDLPATRLFRVAAKTVEEQRQYQQCEPSAEDQEREKRSAQQQGDASFVRWWAVIRPLPDDRLSDLEQRAARLEGERSLILAGTTQPAQELTARRVSGGGVGDPSDGSARPEWTRQELIRLTPKPHIGGTTFDRLRRAAKVAKGKKGRGFSEPEVKRMLAKAPKAVPQAARGIIAAWTPLLDSHG